MALQYASIDVVEHKTAISCTTIVTLSETALCRLTQYKCEVWAMSITIQMTYTLILRKWIIF